MTNPEACTPTNRGARASDSCPMRNCRVCFPPNQWQEYQFLFKVQESYGFKPEDPTAILIDSPSTFHPHTVGVSHLQHLNIKCGRRGQVWRTIGGVHEASQFPNYKKGKAINKEGINTEAFSLYFLILSVPFISSHSLSHFLSRA